MSDAPEWDTVQGAGRRLGLSERTAQRYANRLSAGDRQEPDVSPDSDGLRRVRVAAMSALVERAKAKRKATVARPVADTDADVTPLVVPVSGGGSAALVAQLQGENARLWEQLAQSNANVGALTSELSKANERAALLIAAVGSGRLQLPAQEAGMHQADDTTHEVRSNDVAQQDAHKGKWWQIWNRRI